MRVNEDHSSRGGDVGLRKGAERIDADPWGLYQGVAQTVWCGMGGRGVSVAMRHTLVG